MQYVHAPLPQVAAVVAIVMELFVGLALLVGFRVRVLALAMLVFVAGTSLIGHPFWTMTGDSRDLNQVQFLKNLAIMGGMLMVFAYGQMRWSYDHWRARAKLHDTEVQLAHAEGKAEGATAAAEHTTTVVRD